MRDVDHVGFILGDPAVPALPFSSLDLAGAAGALRVEARSRRALLAGDLLHVDVGALDRVADGFLVGRALLLHHDLLDDLRGGAREPSHRIDGPPAGRRVSVFPGAEEF